MEIGRTSHRVFSQGEQKSNDSCREGRPLMHIGSGETPSAIMESIDYSFLMNSKMEGKMKDQSEPGDMSSDQESIKSLNSLPDVLTSELMSLKLRGVRDEKSFLLVDEKENLKASSATSFAVKLGCDKVAMVKVVSIFGNTGEGKSYTLNHTFFNGEEVFPTSDEQESCTLGVWAAFDPQMKVICLDTEGMLGSSANHNQRTRLLLKVLAVSDIVIYRTRAERLHNDMITFLGDASKAYMEHFTRELRAVSQKCEFGGPLSALGPAVIIFHETIHTEVLRPSSHRSAEDQLRQRFADQGLQIESYSSLEYIGTRTRTHPTDFKGLRAAIQHHLENTTVRSWRKPGVVYHALKVLNEKFSGKIEVCAPNSFPDQYFTCSTRCLSCGMRCNNSMNHLWDGIPHTNNGLCKYQHQYDNRVYTCKRCHNNGQEVLVVPKTCSATDSTWLGLAKYAWSGYVLECGHCGIIYRSRQHWYGNKDPEEYVVRTEVRHVWPGCSTVLQGTHNAARKVLDSVSYLSDTVTSVSAGPAKMLSSWMADQVAPTYWKPNSHITKCSKCQYVFFDKEAKHHCRACGEGFCEDCSSKSKPVPERGWGPLPVRVCDKCYEKDSEEDLSDRDTVVGNTDDSEIRARKYGEVVVNTLGSFASVMEYPFGFLKDSARPAYWVPDSEIKQCCVCQTSFTLKIPIHHCRACGRGVCNTCSQGRKPVPSRGWDEPVRVCEECVKQEHML